MQITINIEMKISYIYIAGDEHSRVFSVTAAQQLCNITMQEKSLQYGRKMSLGRKMPLFENIAHFLG